VIAKSVTELIIDGWHELFEVLFNFLGVDAKFLDIESDA